MSNAENASESAVAYEVTVEQGHSARFIVHAPTPEEAQRIALRRWEAGDRPYGQPLSTSISDAKRVPEHDTDDRYDDCICPRLIGRMIDPRPWCAVHGEDGNRGAPGSDPAQ